MFTNSISQREGTIVRFTIGNDFLKTNINVIIIITGFYRNLSSVYIVPLKLGLLSDTSIRRQFQLHLSKIDYQKEEHSLLTNNSTDGLGYNAIGP